MRPTEEAERNYRRSIMLERERKKIVRARAAKKKAKRKNGGPR